MSETERISSFLDRYRRFSEETADERVDEFKQNFQALLGHYNTFRSKFAECNKKEAFDYNIFKIIDVSTSEKTHTLFLKDLLQPDGTHGQGGLFLRSFIDRFISEEKREHFKLEKESGYIVGKEYHTGWGRLDLYVHSNDPQKRFGIVIENKIYASDQEDQLKRYHEFLSKRYKDEQMALFYLTVQGKDASDYTIKQELENELKGKDVLRDISYKNDIKTWLEECMKDVEAFKVKYLLKAYIEVIISL